MKKMIAIALAVLMLAGLATVAFASEYPSPDTSVVHAITIYKVLDGDEQLAETLSVHEGESVTITAPEVAGYVYQRMTIEGNFIRTRNFEDTTDKSVTITVYDSDITVMMYYAKKGTEGGAKPADPSTVGPTGADTPAGGPVDNGATSPDTGVNFALIALVIAMSVCCVIASKKVMEK